MAKHLRILSAICLVVTIVTGCGNEPPTVGEATAFTAVCSQANDGKRVAVDGYLFFPSSFTKSQSVILRLHESDSDDSTPIGVQILFGTGPNQVEEVTDQFSDDDLKVHLADGSVVPFGTPVTVSGTVYFPIVDQVFPCALKNPLVELAD